MNYKKLVLSVYPEAYIHRNLDDGYLDLRYHTSGVNRLIAFENYKFDFQKVTPRTEKELWKKGWNKINSLILEKLES